MGDADQLEQQARGLGLIFNGPQLGENGDIQFYILTDLHHGSFSVHPGRNLVAAHSEFVQRFLLAEQECRRLEFGDADDGPIL